MLDLALFERDADDACGGKSRERDGVEQMHGKTVPHSTSGKQKKKITAVVVGAERLEAATTGERTNKRPRVTIRQSKKLEEQRPRNKQALLPRIIVL